MRKFLIYTSFIIVSVVVVAAFITSTSYIQLGIAVLLYIPLTYFTYNAYAGGIQGATNFKNPLITIQLPTPKPPEKVKEVEHEKVHVADIDKRTFLKIIGATGLSFFLFSLLGRRVEPFLFGSVSNSNNNFTGPVNPGGQTGQAGPLTDGYKITDIDDGLISFYGFTNQDGAWFIMRQDTQTSSFRYAKGNSGFSGNWANREKLKYDYFYKLF